MKVKELKILLNKCKDNVEVLVESNGKFENISDLHINNEVVELHLKDSYSHMDYLEEKDRYN